MIHTTPCSCATEKGAGRAYHQRCHFVPVSERFPGENGNAFCAAFQTKWRARSPKRAKRGRQNTPKSRPSLDLSGLSSSVSSLDGAEVGQDGAARKKQLEPSHLE